ncbi:MAG: AsmA family protein [Rhodospirillales bacterium]|nr:AsmA family protein [Rhodospirillales bacterium]
MKNFLLGVATLIVVLVGAVLVLPGLIDWNEYKVEIASRARDLTGREVTLKGDIRLALLPAPALRVTDVALASLPGAKDAELVRLKALEVRIALAPLFSGQIEIETVRLVEPVFALEILRDGRRTWDFAPAASAAMPAQPGRAPDPARSPGPAVRIDSFVVENGTVVYRDAAAGIEERIETIAARVTAATLEGPFESSGSFRARGMALGYVVGIGKLADDRAIPVNLSLNIAGAKLQSTGTVSGLAQVPRYRGKVKIEGESLAAVLALAAEGMPAPPLAQPFMVEGALTASAAMLELKDLDIRLGESRGTGAIAAKLQGGVNAAVQVSINRLDLDRWLAASAEAGPEGSAPAPGGKAKDAAKSDAKAKSSRQAAGGGASSERGLSPAAREGGPIIGAGLSSATAVVPPASASAPAPTPFAIPKDVAVTLALAADAITLRGGLIGQARLKAEIADGEITLSQISAQLPGSSDVAAFGFVTAAAGQPKFDGQADVTIGDLRALLKWLDVAPPDVPAERLRSLKFSGKIAATPADVRLTGLDLALDGSRLTGTVSAGFARKPTYGLDLVLDRINLDSYFPPGPAAPKAAPATPVTRMSADAAPKAAPAAAAAASRAVALQGIPEFDADVKLVVKAATARGMAVRDAVLDATLKNRTLEVRRLAVADLAGIALAVSGRVDGLTDLPLARDVQFDVRVPDAGRAARAFGIEPPDLVRGLGAVTASGKINGNFLAPQIEAKIGAAGATATFAGKAAVLPALILEGTANINHDDPVRLAGALGIAYRPAGKVGPLAFSGQIKTGADTVEVTGLKLSAGATTMAGSLKVATGGARPRLSADLTAGELAVDSFLPVKKAAALPLEPFAPGGEGRPTERPGAKYAAGSLNFGAAAPGGEGRPTERPGAKYAAGSLNFGAAAPGGVILAQVRQPTPARPAPPPATGRGSWPTEPLDFSALKEMDADVKLKAKTLAYDKYRIEDADIAARLDAGSLRTERLAGRLFGGDFQGALALNAQSAAAPRFDASFALKEGDVAAAVHAFTGEASATGRIAMDAKLAAAGGSVAAMVGSLGGSGSVALTRLDVKGGGKGSALAGALDLVKALGELGGALSGRPGGSQADVTGSFTLERGVARSSDLKLASGFGNGQARGTVDLPRWHIDMAGEIQLAQNVLTQILDRSGRAAQPVPFTVVGALDAPTVKLDTSKLPGGLPISGVDKLLKKPGVGDVLQGIIGGQPPQQPQQPQQQQQPAQKQQPVRPQDLLRGILR